MRKPSAAALQAGLQSGSQATAQNPCLLLERLKSAEAQAGWKEFLLLYSPLLYQAALAMTRADDEASDCFVYICEQLAKNGFHRLLQFNVDGTASFSTWLRVVARNLCLDWHRKTHGRLRPFKSIQNLSTLELEVYRCRYERCLSRDETLQCLRPSWPAIDAHQLADIENRIENCLNSRQRWLLNIWKQRESNESISEEEETTQQFAAAIDSGQDPESMAADRQQRARLQKCLELLPATERLIVQLRFEKELSLDEISKLTGLGDAQRVHRHLGSILQKLRAAMGTKRGRKTGTSVREMKQGAK